MKDEFLEYLKTRIENLKDIIEVAKNRSKISAEYYKEKLFTIEEIQEHYEKMARK
tara:strand:- start:317 stop:481 length:165 start_codon:yes stop_codon:yes gene_type:complete